MGFAGGARSLYNFSITVHVSDCLVRWLIAWRFADEAVAAAATLGKSSRISYSGFQFGTSTSKASSTCVLAMQHV